MNAIFIIVGLIAIIVLLRPFVKKQEMEALASSEELLRFFGPDDELSGSELQRKVETVTAGARRSVPFIYKQLDYLVKNGLLSVKEVVKVIDGAEYRVKKYFLPK